MTIDTSSSPLMARPSFAELYMPKLVTVLCEGYGLADAVVEGRSV